MCFETFQDKLLRTLAQTDFVFSLNILKNKENFDCVEPFQAKNNV